MGMLLVDRVTPCIKPFPYTGVSHFQEKSYVALFTYLIVRAVHTAIVTGLSTDSFLVSLRNFIDGCGAPIQSDNGRNSVGINNFKMNYSLWITMNKFAIHYLWV